MNPLTKNLIYAGGLDIVQMCRPTTSHKLLTIKYNIIYAYQTTYLC